MAGVVRWFEKQGEIPLVPPPEVREYASLTDDPDRFGGGYSVAGVRGVAFAIEYCDSHGWTSTRTIRCLGIDTRHPASVTAYCHVRDKLCRFRLDRVISIMRLRTGAFLSADEHLALLAPYLPDQNPPAYLASLMTMQDATRDGVYALLQLAMRKGRLQDEPRRHVLDYVHAEAVARSIPLPSGDLVEIWVDNLAPPLDAVAGAVTRLLDDRQRFARFLPFVLKIVRSIEDFPRPEESVRELMSEVRLHFKHPPSGHPRPVQATR